MSNLTLFKRTGSNTLFRNFGRCYIVVVHIFAGWQVSCMEPVGTGTEKVPHFFPARRTFYGAERVVVVRCKNFMQKEGPFLPVERVVSWRMGVFIAD